MKKTNIAIEATEEPLSPRETEVLTMASTGLGSGEVARSLFISKRTVDFHLASAYRKLGAPNRICAIIAAKRLEYIP